MPNVEILEDLLICTNESGFLDVKFSDDLVELIKSVEKRCIFNLQTHLLNWNQVIGIGSISSTSALLVLKMRDSIKAWN